MWLCDDLWSVYENSRPIETTLSVTGLRKNISYAKNITNYAFLSEKKYVEPATKKTQQYCCISNMLQTKYYTLMHYAMVLCLFVM